jgi:hypothetical protein
MRSGVNFAYAKVLIQERFQEAVMQMAITFLAVVAGMAFSLAVALLAEELIFGQVFRLFARQAATMKSEDKR